MPETTQQRRPPAAGTGCLHQAACGGPPSGKPRRHWRLLCALTLSALGGYHAMASAETLGEAWRRGLEASDQLNASAKQVQAAEAQVRAAEAARWPSVSATGSYLALDRELEIEPDIPDEITVDSGIPLIGQITTPIPAEFQTFPLADQQFPQAGISATLPLYTGGQIASTIAAAESRLSASRAQRQGTEQQVLMDVATAYLGVLRARHGLTATQKQVDTLQSHVEDVGNLLRQGYVPRGDLLAVQTALAEARDRRSRARDAVDLAEANYNRLLARPLEAPVNLADLRPREDLPPLEQAVAQAQRNRPELKTLQAGIESLGHAADAVRAQMMPRLAAVAGYNYIGVDLLKENTFGYVGLGLQWRLFDFGLTGGQVESVVAQAGSAEDQLAAARKGIELQVRQAWLQAQTSLDRVEVARQGLSYAEESLQDVRNRYSNQLATNAEVLDAETRRTGAFARYHNAIYEAVGNQIRLRYVSGQLSPAEAFGSQDTWSVTTP